MTSNVIVQDSNGTKVEIGLHELKKKQVTITLNDGRKVNIPRELFQQQDGNKIYSLPFSFDQIDNSDRIVIPLVSEEVHTSKRLIVKDKVSVSKSVTEREQIITETLLDDDVRIERVSVNMFVDEEESIQYDDDEIIIPLYEEVLVVEKRLKLKERVHLVRHRQETDVHKTEIVREETVEIERRQTDS